MILDERYEAIREFRKTELSCPFSRLIDKTGGRNNCFRCELLFPEVSGTKGAVDGYLYCPCALLGNDYVKSEMRRLFP